MAWCRVQWPLLLGNGDDFFSESIVRIGHSSDSSLCLVELSHGLLIQREISINNVDITERNSMLCKDWGKTAKNETFRGKLDRCKF